MDTSVKEKPQPKRRNMRHATPVKHSTAYLLHMEPTLYVRLKWRAQEQGVSLAKLLAAGVAAIAVDGKSTTPTYPVGEGTNGLTSTLGERSLAQRQAHVKRARYAGPDNERKTD